MAWANYICRLRKSYRQHYDTENDQWNEHVRDRGSKCQGWATERGWQHDLKAHRTEPSSQDQLQRPVKREYSALMTKISQQDMMPTTWAGTGTEPEHRYTDRHTTRAHGAGGPWRAHTNLTTQLRRSTNGSGTKSRQHSLTQANRARSAMCLNPPHGISITLMWRYKSLTSGNMTPSSTQPTKQATSRVNLNGVERRKRVSVICQVARPVVTQIGQNSDEVYRVKYNFKLNKSRQVDKLWIWIKLQCQKPRLILVLRWHWENSQVPDRM